MNTVKALVLEDNPLLAQSLQDMLITEGWKTSLSYSWGEASSLIHTNHFDLFVLDILLPDKKGFEILKILPENKMSPHLKIILISGFVEESFAQKNIPPHLKSHCVFFKKPIDEKVFLNFLQKIKSSDWNNKEASFFEKGCPSQPLGFYLSQNKTFDSKDLIFSVFLAHLKKFTGEFKITTNNKTEILIQFYNGHIIKLTSNSETSFFGALLVEHGLSLKEDIEALLENKKSNQLIGKLLVEKELLSQHMLNFMLKEQVKIRLSEIMSHPSFKLNILEKPFENNTPLDMDFDETDFIEWLADSAQTELTEEFFKNFYMSVKFCLIQKSSQINKVVISQKRFLQDYNLLFKNLKEGAPVKDIINNSIDQHHSFQLLYFGLLTKSIYLKNQKEASMDIQKTDLFLDSIIEKDSENLFALLNLPWDASSQEAEKSYKQIIQKIHPDLAPSDVNDQLKEKFKKAFHKITKSYDTLKDQEKRKEYVKQKKEENFVTVINKYEEGVTHIKKGNYKSGLKILLRIANHKHAPSNTFLYVLWAKLKSGNEDLIKQREKAIKIKKAIDFCPISLRTSPLFWYVKGLFYAQTERYDRAVELFNKSLAVQKDFMEAKRELILIKQNLKNEQAKNKKGLFDFLFKKPG